MGSCASRSWSRSRTRSRPSAAVWKRSSGWQCCSCGCHPRTSKSRSRSSPGRRGRAASGSDGRSLRREPAASGQSSHPRTPRDRRGIRAHRAGEGRRISTRTDAEAGRAVRPRDRNRTAIPDPVAHRRTAARGARRCARRGGGSSRAPGCVNDPASRDDGRRSARGGAGRPHRRCDWTLRTPDVAGRRRISRAALTGSLTIGALIHWK